VLNDLEQLVAIGPENIAPDTDGESSEEQDEQEEEKSGIEISEPGESPPASSNELENQDNQQVAFDDYLKSWGAKLNS